MSQPAPPPDERPATAPSPRQGLTSRSATHRVAAKISLVRDSSVERLDLEHRIAAWKRQSRIAMLERRDFILENRKELPTRTFASVYQRRSKLYVEQCHRGEQARARKSEQIRQVEQKVAEKGLRDAKRLAEVQARRIEQIRLVEQKIIERSLADAKRHAEVQQRREEASPRCPSNHLSGAAFLPSSSHAPGRSYVCSLARVQEQARLESAKAQLQLSTPRLQTPRLGTARAHLPAVTASPRRPRTAPELSSGAASARRRRGLPDAQANSPTGSPAT